MVKSFQYNPRKTTEKTEDDVNTLITGTAPLVSTYDDTNNTLTLSVNNGISDGNLLKCNANVSDNDYLKIDGTSVEGRTAAELLSDIGGTGISENNLLKCGANVVDGDFLKTNGSIVETRTAGEVKADLDLENADIHTIMEDIIDFTAGNGVNRSLELKLPLGTGDSGLGALNTPLTLKHNGISTGTSITTTQLLLSGSGSSGGLGTSTDTDLTLFRNGSSNDKITIGSTLNTIEENCRFKKFCSVGEPSFHINTSVSTTFNPLVPLMVGTIGTQTLTGNLNEGGDTGGNNYQSYRRYFHPTGNYTGDTSTTTGNISLYAEGHIISKTFLIVANGSNFTSDDRFKTQEQSVENATETLMKLKPKTYMKHTDYEVSEDNEDPVDLDASGNKISQRKETGLIAQEVLTQVPELEHIVGEHWDLEKEKFILNMDYIQIIPYLIKSNQELNQRIIELENKNNVE